MTHLTPTESSIASLLEANADRVVPYAEVAAVLGYAVVYQPAKLVRTHIHNLRDKGVPVVSVRGEGVTMGAAMPPDRPVRVPGSPTMRQVACADCGREFTYEARPRRAPYRYCPEHRTKAARWQRWLRRQAQREAA